MTSIDPARFQPALPIDRFIVADSPGADAIEMDVLFVGAGSGRAGRSDRTGSSGRGRYGDRFARDRSDREGREPGRAQSLGRGRQPASVPGDVSRSA